MKRRTLLSAAAGTACTRGVAAADAVAPPPPTEMKPLGNDRYQIGRIVVDKRARSFVVPGRIHALDKPLEYLATTRGGRKAYESLLELDVSGTEFNLACILVGLEREADLPGWKPPEPGAPGRPPVRLSVAWTDGGQRRQVTAAQALFNAQGQAANDAVGWAYTGSFTSMDGSKFAADHTGTLIGFIKDPTGIIEAASGVVPGPYGAVRGSAMLPPEGTAVELIVEAGQPSR